LTEEEIELDIEDEEPSHIARHSSIAVSTGSLSSSSGASMFEDRNLCDRCFPPREFKQIEKLSGYRLEHSDKPPLEVTPSYYQDQFMQVDHITLVGRIKYSTITEPFVLFIKTATVDGKYPALLRRKSGDELLALQTEMSSSISKTTKDKQFLTHIKEMIKAKTKLPKFKLKLLAVNRDFEFLKEKMKEYEFLDPQKPTCHSIGVLYCQAGQTNEAEMFNNEHGSEAFEHFLHILGDRIELEGFGGYRGDLDVKSNSTGTHSIYTRYNEFEIMFHISTLLPFNANDQQQVQRKSRIGNDLSVIIFQDGEATLTQPISSQFLHVYTTISPVQLNDRTYYRVSSARKDGVPKFGPALHDSTLFESGEDFRNLLLTKLINGNLAALRAPELSRLFSKPKELFLNEVAEFYMGVDK